MNFAENAIGNLNAINITAETENLINRAADKKMWGQEENHLHMSNCCIRITFQRRALLYPLITGMA